MSETSPDSKWQERACALLRRLSIQCHRVEGVYVRTRTPWEDEWTVEEAANPPLIDSYNYEGSKALEFVTARRGQEGPELASIEQGARMPFLPLVKFGQVQPENI